MKKRNPSPGASWHKTKANGMFLGFIACMTCVILMSMVPGAFISTLGFFLLGLSALGAEYLILLDDEESGND